MVLSLKVVAFLYIITDSLNLYQISKPHGLFAPELETNQIIENALKCFAPISLLSFIAKSRSKLS